MNLLYPKFPVKHLPVMLRTALLGAVIAGCYGALHDQVSYSISPEYFTKLKFRQFFYADFGSPGRVFASEVGFLASCWVGLFAGWFVARAGLAEFPPAIRRKCTLKSFAILLITCPLCGLAGALVGVVSTRHGHLGGWVYLQTALDLHDLRSFVIVGYLHAGSYLGALIGLIVAVVYVRGQAVRSRTVK